MPMRAHTTIPAELLNSTCSRYALPWLRRAPPHWNGERQMPGTSTSAAANDALPVEQNSSCDSALVRLEAVLLMAREPLSSRKLSQFANLADGTQARTLVRRL